MPLASAVDWSCLQQLPLGNQAMHGEPSAVDDDDVLDQLSLQIMVLVLAPMRTKDLILQQLDPHDHLGSISFKA